MVLQEQSLQTLRGQQAEEHQLAAMSRLGHELHPLELLDSASS